MDAVADKNEVKQEVTYSVSPNFVGFMQAHTFAIAFTSYQSGNLYILSRNPKGGLMVDARNFRKAMGVFSTDRELYLASAFQLHVFGNCLKENERANELFDHCFVPRVSYTTGPLDAHDIALDRAGRILFVNTSFNCNATTSPNHSFTEFWRPEFVSRLIREDRCHLNGMALVDGELAYVTAVSASDTIDGWRDRRADGGVVIDTKTNKIIAKGLSMPHSPRWHDGKLWVLNSGTGELGFINQDKSPEDAFEPVMFLPGFVRGLAFHDGYAIVGLSRPRYERFEGLDLDRRLQEVDSEPWCGVQIIDLNKRTVVAWFRIDGAVQELYDVAALPSVFCGMSLGFNAPELTSLVTFEEAR